MRDDAEKKSLSHLTSQDGPPSCPDQLGRSTRESNRHPDEYALPYDSYSRPTDTLDGGNRVKEAMEELERQNRYLRDLVVSLSETIVRQVAAKSKLATDCEAGKDANVTGSTAN